MQKIYISINFYKFLPTRLPEGNFALPELAQIHKKIEVLSLACPNTQKLRLLCPSLFLNNSLFECIIKVVLYIKWKIGMYIFFETGVAFLKNFYEWNDATSQSIFRTKIIVFYKMIITATQKWASKFLQVHISQCFKIPKKVQFNLRKSLIKDMSWLKSAFSNGVGKWLDPLYRLYCTIFFKFLEYYNAAK